MLIIVIRNWHHIGQLHVSGCYFDDRLVSRLCQCNVEWQPFVFVTARVLPLCACVDKRCSN